MITENPVIRGRLFLQMNITFAIHTPVCIDTAVIYGIIPLDAILVTFTGKMVYLCTVKICPYGYFTHTTGQALVNKY